MIQEIRYLCRKYTDLSQADIEKLVDCSQWLHLAGEVHQGDIFIDCKTRDPDKAIVVAEIKGEDSPYEEIVVGKFALKDREPAVLRTLHTGEKTFHLDGLNQEGRSIFQTTTAIRNKGKVIGVLVIEKALGPEDAHEEKKEGLKNPKGEKNENLIPLVDEFSKDGFLIFDLEGRLIYENLAAEKLYKHLGYQQSIQGMNFENLSFGDVHFRDLLETDFLETQDLALGQNYYTIKYSRLLEEEKIVMVIQDTTLLKRQKEALEAKSTLLKEVHNRVKNNLKTIVSLLNLQARVAGDSRVKKAFRESTNRILSIAAIHEILAREPEDQVDLKEVIHKLLFSSNYIGTEDQRVEEVQIYGEGIQVPSSKASSLAMIINELVANAYEHAFSKGDRGIIEIHLQEEGGQALITVEDNGRGFQVNQVKKTSFGLDLVQNLTEKNLKGRVNITSKKGKTKISLSFPLEDKGSVIQEKKW